jgi:regulatory protein
MMNELERMYSKMAYLCSAKEYCCADIKNKLVRFDMEENAIHTIIEKLVKENYINENRYATAFANDKWKFSHWGKLKIQFALRQKDVSGKDIEQALAAIDPDQYREMVFKQLKLKANKTEELNAKEKAKILRFGASRGYENDIIYSFLNSLNR